MPAAAKPRLRALFVLDNLELSGAEKAAINLLRHADEFKAVALKGAICMDDRIGHAQVAPNLLHLTAGARDSSLFLQRLCRAWTAVRTLRRLAKQFDILVPVTPPAALLATVAALFSGPPVAPWVHYDLDGIERERWPKGRRFRGWLQGVLYKRFVPSFDRLIFVSDTCRASFARRHGGQTKKTWIVLPNLFDPEAFDPRAPSSTEAAMRQLKKAGRPVLLFLGRLFRQKRWEDAIVTAEILMQSEFEFNMAFIGDGIERDQLEARLERSPAKPMLHYLGPDKNPKPSLELSDGLLLTSLFEAWPMVILEAFAAEVPVFCYDCPSGPKDMLGSGARGVLVPESPAHMAQAVIAYYRAHEGARQAMREAAKAFAAGFLPRMVAPKWDCGIPNILGPLSSTRDSQA